MPANLGGRAIAGLAVIAGVVILTFFLLHIAPGDPAEHLLGPAATPAQIAAGRHALGLDRPLVDQFTAWIGSALRGNWGMSTSTGRPVREVLAEAWPATVWLIGLSLVLSYLVGLAIAVGQVVHVGSRTDTAISILTVTLAAVPGYWLGLMLVVVCSYGLRALPAFGAAGLDADLLTGWSRAGDALRHLALPLATLTLIGAGGVARFSRAALLEVAALPFVTTARAKGAPAGRVMLHHILFNALTPIVTLLGLSLPALFSGAVFIEAVFAWPGVGGILVAAVRARDYPVVMAATTVSAVLVVTGNLLADMLSAWIDPRVRDRDQPT